MTYRQLLSLSLVILFTLTTGLSRTGIQQLNAGQFGSAPARRQVASTNATQQSSLTIEIPDEPRTVDPVTLVPAKLAELVTVELNEMTLKKFVTWLQEERKINVVLNERSISNNKEEDIDNVFSEKSVDAPLYLMLNRICRLYDTSWYFRDDVIYIATDEVVEAHYSTVNYNVGDLLDSGFTESALIFTLQSHSSGSWVNINGEGGTNVLLGDVLFVR